MATGTLSPSTAEGKEAPRVADFDELVDEVLAKKGPSKYTDGLSEDNWEEVSKTRTLGTPHSKRYPSLWC